MTVSWHGPMTTRNINSTMYLIMCLPDLPLAIFQCYQQDRRSTPRIIVWIFSRQSLRRKVINLSSNVSDSKSVFAKIYVLRVIICINKIGGFSDIFLLRGIFGQELSTCPRIIAFEITLLHTTSS